MILQWSALFPVVLTLVATKKSSPKLLANICYPKWALEAFVIVNAKRSAMLSIVFNFIYISLINFFGVI